MKKYIFFKNLGNFNILWMKNKLQVYGIIYFVYIFYYVFFMCIVYIIFLNEFHILFKSIDSSYKTIL